MSTVRAVPRGTEVETGCGKGCALPATAARRTLGLRAAVGDIPVYSATVPLQLLFARAAPRALRSALVYCHVNNFATGACADSRHGP